MFFGFFNCFNCLQNRIKKELVRINNEDTKYLLELLESNDYDKIKSELPKFKKYIKEDLLSFVTPKSVWTIGGDGWAYDIGFGFRYCSSIRRIRIRHLFFLLFVGFLLQ